MHLVLVKVRWVLCSIGSRQVHPTLQKHACEVKWKLEIAHRCGLYVQIVCGCVRECEFSIWPCDELALWQHGPEDPRASEFKNKRLLKNGWMHFLRLLKIVDCEVVFSTPGLEKQG